jgi:hypothetical protein
LQICAPHLQAKVLDAFIACDVHLPHSQESCDPHVITRRGPQIQQQLFGAATSHQSAHLAVTANVAQLTFKYALICFFPSITQGNNLVLSVIAVCRRPCESSSSFADGVEGNDLIKYMTVLKWERMKRGRLSWDAGGADTLLFGFA